MSVIYVTHDQVEAMTLADKIVVLQDGQIEQIGSPMDLYNDPDNQFVAGFIGSPAMNFLDAKLLNLPPEVKTIGLRPEVIKIQKSGKLSGVISHLEHLGADTNVYVLIGETLVTVRESGETRYTIGSKVKLDFKAENLLRFTQEGVRIR
jgi:multiple sugar transport system ATP-binding protein